MRINCTGHSNFMIKMEVVKLILMRWSLFLQNFVKYVREQKSINQGRVDHGLNLFFGCCQTLLCRKPITRSGHLNWKKHKVLAYSRLIESVGWRSTTSLIFSMLLFLKPNHLCSFYLFCVSHVLLCWLCCFTSRLQLVHILCLWSPANS